MESAHQPGGPTLLHGQLLWTMNNLLTRKECEGVIAAAEEKGFKASPVSGGGHGRTGREEARTSHFCVFGEDSPLSQKWSSVLWQRVGAHMPRDLSLISDDNAYLSTQSRGAEWAPFSVLPKLRVYRYEPGQLFGPHVDYKTGRTIVQADGSSRREQTFFTLLVYLNEAFEGGETSYHVDYASADDPKGLHCRFKRDASGVAPTHLITPVTGMGVIQEQNLLHEGLPPSKGVKYILRTDIVHFKVTPKHPKLKDCPKPHVGDWERLFETSCKSYAE